MAEMTPLAIKAPCTPPVYTGFNETEGWCYVRRDTEIESALVRVTGSAVASNVTVVLNLLT